MLNQMSRDRLKLCDMNNSARICLLDLARINCYFKDVVSMSDAATGDMPVVTSTLNTTKSGWVIL